MAFDKKSLLLASALLLSFSEVTQSQTETKDVAIDFAAYIGEDEFVCGESYDGVGVNESTITPTDFRFYVSNLALIDENGEAVPVELEQDGKWQHESTALLDFEDGTSACDNGTAEINTTVVGTIPEGDYQSLQFTLGVPEKLNHEDAAIAPSPLNLTSMWWNWQGGYKFLRVEMETDEPIATVGDVNTNDSEQSSVLVSEQSTQTSSEGRQQTTHQNSRQASIFKEGQGQRSQTSSTQTTHQNGGHSTHSQTHSQASETHNNHENMGGNAYLIHLGSTGCSDSAQSSLFNCRNSNRAKIVLEDFNPDKDVVVADLAELLAQSNLTTNQANTPNGCMSSPDDADCMPIMQNLSLSSNTTDEPEQRFFFVE